MSGLTVKGQMADYTRVFIASMYYMNALLQKLVCIGLTKR